MRISAFGNLTTLALSIAIGRTSARSRRTTDLSFHAMSHFFPPADCVFVAVISIAFIVCSLVTPNALAASPGLASNTCSDLRAGTLTLNNNPERKLPLLYGDGLTKSIIVSTDERSREMNVNSDGSPRAYHLLDPRGARYALNDMPSGGVRVYEDGEEISWSDAGLSNDEMKARISRYYSVFARFVAENDNFGISESSYDPRKDARYTVGDDFGNNLDPAPQLTLRGYLSSIKDLFAGRDIEALATERSAEREAMLKAPLDNRTYNCLSCRLTMCQVCFKRAIIASDSNDKLCIRKSGRYAGFLVNKTSLDRFAANAPDAENTEDTTCATPINLDSEKLPGMVIPGGTLSPDNVPAVRAGVGDIVVGYDPETDKWSFGVISDVGPKGKLGEASIAFNRTLSLGYRAGATYPRPISYRGNLLGKPYQPLRPIHLLLLPGTKMKFKLPVSTSGDKVFDFSPKNVASTAKAAFLAWAAASDLEAARKRFESCVALLKE